MENATVSSAGDGVTFKVIDILKEMTDDWDLDSDEEINEKTQLIGDLAFESIDIVQLVVALEQGFDRRNIPFDKLLMTEGRYVDDLSVAQIADFLRRNA